MCCVFFYVKNIITINIDVGEIVVDGIFVSFEGPDGSGKTTQILELQKKCENAQIRVVLTREPGGTIISDKIRYMLLDPANKLMGNETEILLYAASRSQHINEIIVPCLAQGMVVICDRYVDSSVAYQGYGCEIDPNIIIDINNFAIKGIMPNRTYMVHVPMTTSLDRLKYRGQLDRIEQRELKYHENVLIGFEKIAQQNQDRILVLDGTRTIKEVGDDIWDDFKKVYKNIKGVQL